MFHPGDRVRQQTPAKTRQEIDRNTAEAVESHAHDSAALHHRLNELDEEWDIERALFAVTSVNMLLGLSASTRNRRWLAWPFAVAAFQFQHAVQGWCPPVSVLRRLGFRTRREIDTERTALKALRGDFRTASELQPADVLRAASR